MWPEGPLVDHGDTLRRFKDQGLRAKKSFGQNFLHDRGLAARIAERCTTPPGGTVLEIGAGLGALTGPLLERAGRVVAIERDRDLVPILTETFVDAAHLQVVEADAVGWDWASAFVDAPRPYVVAGNLPYQLSGRLVERAVHMARHIDGAVFMLQREVVQRLAASPGAGDYGVLSVFTQAAFSVEMVLKAPAGAFTPAPKVASAVVALTPHADGPRAEEDEAFRQVVKRAFAQRRKKLRNNWKGLFELDADGLRQMASEVEVDLDLRAETLTVEDFARVAAWGRGR